MPVHSGRDLAVHPNVETTTEMALKKGADVEVGCSPAHAVSRGVGARGESESSSESDESLNDSNESEKASLPVPAKLGEVRNSSRSFQRANFS